MRHPRSNSFSPLRLARSAAGLAAVLLLPAMAGLALAAPPTGLDPAPSAREWRGAECVAALRARADGHAAAIRAGQSTQAAALRADLERGAAIIGSGYLAGDRDEDRGKLLLEKASERQTRLETGELQRLQAGCAQEADALLARANMLERALVQQAAKRRMAKMLQPRGSASSAPTPGPGQG